MTQSCDLGTTPHYRAVVLIKVYSMIIILIMVYSNVAKQFSTERSEFIILQMFCVTEK
jgi:hypothetical protein